MNARRRITVSTSLIVCITTWAANADDVSPNYSMGAFCEKLPRQEYADLARISDRDSWFQVYQVAEGVKAIYEPHQWQETISYLIEGDDRALLFDTGNGIGDIYALIKRLTEKPIVVLNSHSHFDHVGGNHAFQRIYGLKTSFGKNRELGVAHKDIAEEVSNDALCRPLPKYVSAQAHTGKPYKITNYIEDGHIFELGERSLEVIQVPGHTPDALALIDRENRLLWTGDTFYPGPIWLYAPETSLRQYEKSLARLMAEHLNVDYLLPAHNIPKVSAKLLPRVQSAFEKVMAGSAKRQESFQGTVIYSIEGETKFSFLLRDNAYSYTR